jgi:Skp family chaperone for outer membrane proteins
MEDCFQKSSNHWIIGIKKVPTIGHISYWLFAALFLFCGQIASAQPSERGTVAFVDFEQVFTNYFKTKLANDQLLEMSDSINRERASMVMQFDQLQKEYEALRDKIIKETPVDPELTKIRREIDEKVVAIRRLDERIVKYNESQEKRWDEQNRRIRNSLVEEIREKINGYIVAKGYRAVVDSSQVNEKNIPIVLFVDPEADITAAVIAELNK